MKKGLTEVVFILDRSGSMSGLERDTIGGFNSLLKKQRTEEGDVIVSTVLFDHLSEVLHDRVPLEKVEPMTEKEYYVRGSTALLDAVGGSVHHIKKVHKKMAENERPEKVLVVITTDGMENASTEYGYEEVRHLIEKQKKKGWEFIFLGANMDAASFAGKFGIRREKAVTYKCDSAGTAVNFNALSGVISAVRRAPSLKEAESEICEELKAVHEYREQSRA